MFSLEGLVPSVNMPILQAWAECEVTDVFWRGVWPAFVTPLFNDYLINPNPYNRIVRAIFTWSGGLGGKNVL